MKVLSTKLELIKEFGEEEMNSVIIRWLKGNEPCKAIGTEYENTADKSAVHLKDGYCQIDTFKTENDKGVFSLFKFEQTYYEQLWQVYRSKSLLTFRPIFTFLGAFSGVFD